MKAQFKICVLGSIALLTSCGTQKEENVSLSIEQSTLDNVDKSINPGDDFYTYATGTWTKKNPIPEFWPCWSPSVIEDDKQMERICEEMKNTSVATNPDGSVEKIIGDFYALYMDTVRLKEYGTKPIQPYLQKIASFTDRKELLKWSAEEHTYFAIAVQCSGDDKDSKNNIIHVLRYPRTFFDYMCLGLDDYTRQIKTAYEKVMDDALVLCGYDKEKALSIRTKAMDLKTQLSSYTLEYQEFRDPSNNYHKMSVKEAETALGGFDLSQYLKDYGYDQTEIVNIHHVEPLKKSCELLMNTPLEDLKALFIWQFIEDNKLVLGPEMERIEQSFMNVLSNNEDKTPRWKKVYTQANEIMPEALGHFYVNKFFSDKKREKVLEMIKYLKMAYNERIGEQEWLSEETKQLAIDKVNDMESYVGYGSCFIDYSGLSFNRDSSLFSNVRNMRKFVWDWQKEKKYNKPVDKGLWEGVYSHAVNAFYRSETSTINILAAFLRNPRFDENAEDPYNYAILGDCIGHEMSHGFDSNGRYYDKNGNNTDWWTAKDSENFKVLCDQYVAYFDTLKVLPDLNCNGKLTLSENVADLGGVKAAFRAMQLANADKKIPDMYGYTSEQRFFIYYANLFLFNSNEAMIRNQAISDEHAVNYLRVNGPLAHVDEWYEAFGIKPGDKMYIPKEKRVKIW